MTADPDEIAGLDGGAFNGAFQRTGERLRMAFYPAGKNQRPASFEIKVDDDQMTFEMQRVSN